ncbi:MAG: ATP-dependent DNA helicase, partial [Lachnospiraceae bacterium]|nr:ATP-dependent DNA helicase [Lachnospiraceae bacterium]
MGSEGINKNTTATISISVRELVEFAERSGDIDNRTARTDPDAMQEGARLHRKIQKEYGSGYSAEVSLKYDAFEEYDGEEMIFSIDGRADGIFSEDITFIDEIKTTYKKVENMEEPIKVHLAQAKCYAYIYAEQNGLSEAGVRMSYANLESEEKKFFHYRYTFEELESWFKSITHEYAKWIAWQMKWVRRRNASIKNVAFPFSYRDGQKDLAAGVYRTILRRKKLFLEAPTGVGKTISTVFPAVKAMGEGLTSKLFYGTAKTIARTVAEEAFSVLMDKGLEFKAVTITAKEKICVLEKPACNPDECPRAKGHFDRVNTCVYDMLNNEGRITRDLILAYAEKYNVCPFEMCLDVTTWADAVICDYNYLFDPNVYLRRFFA